jgi:glutamate N-acetyltransferase / amino-acid N-acetyltransferase
MKINVPGGFLFSSAAAGIKVSGRQDCAYAEAPDGATAAALFTRNLVVAAPVEVGRANLKLSGGKVRAVIANSGNANCATGKAGIRACESVCKSAAKLLKTKPEFVFPSSTGIIGVPLPAEKLAAAVPQLLANKAEGPDAVRCFAQAIMTTDTRPKIASICFEVPQVSARKAGAPGSHGLGAPGSHGSGAPGSHAGFSRANLGPDDGARTFSVMGVAKGSGMIHPNLATMLVYIFTDLEADAAELRNPLARACDASFNCIMVDNDTSTNDTVLLLASGKSGVPLRQARTQFSEALSFVCQSLAEQIVADGEGASHVMRLHVEQARTRQEALAIARSIASSMLVKTALTGCDPNWGRIIAAAGYSGVKFDPAKVNIYIGPQMVCRNGEARAFDQQAAHEYLTQPSYDIRVQMGRGKASADFLTTDLTAEYVKINAEYST